MDERLLPKIGVTIVVVVMILRGLRDIRRYMKVEIPQQLTQLVRQAHLDQPFQTMWNIEVSDEMRDALQLPLTAQQIHSLKQAKDDMISRYVSCDLISYKRKGHELSGVVNVSINIRSRSGKNSICVSDAKLRITIRNTANPKRIDNKWFVSSVEQV